MGLEVTTYDDFARRRRTFMQAQLRVVKADGSVEEYLHTKVVGSINNALGAAGEPDIDVAEQFAEVVTFFLYHQQTRRRVDSSEILSMIEVVLASTGYEAAAAALSEHHFDRKLKRGRTEVIPVDIDDLNDAEFFVETEQTGDRRRWDKSRIAEDLVAAHGLDRQAARVVAAMVEEKIFSMGMTRIPSGLIKQLALRDAAAVLHAREQLQTA
jgi:transcriptional regulator NrdR family protein